MAGCGWLVRVELKVLIFYDIQFPLILIFLNLLFRMFDMFCNISSFDKTRFNKNYKRLSCSLSFVVSSIGFSWAADKEFKLSIYSYFHADLYA